MMTTFLPILLVLFSLLGRGPVVGGELTAPTFSLTASRDGVHITLRYPADVGEWREVCIMTVGRDQGPDNIDWSEFNCWKPFFKIEQFHLRTGALRVRAGLITTKDGVRTDWHTPWVNVRVDPGGAE